MRIPPERQTARLLVEKRKKGKTVVTVRGLSAEHNDLPDLLTRIKSACGAGGTLKEGVLEIQGKQLDRVRDFLGKQGFRTKG